MKPIKGKEVRDLKIKIMESKKRYITEVMEFRKKILKESTSNLRKKKELR